MDFYKYRCETLFIQCPKVRIPELKHKAIKRANPVRGWELAFIMDSSNQSISITIISGQLHSPKADVIFRIRYNYYNVYTMERIGYRLKCRYKYEEQHIPLGKLRVLKFKRRY